MKPEFKPMSKRCPKCNKLVFINSLQQTETECPDCRTQFKIIHLLRRGVKLVEKEDETRESKTKTLQQIRDECTWCNEGYQCLGCNGCLQEYVEQSKATKNEHKINIPNTKKEV